MTYRFIRGVKLGVANTGLAGAGLLAKVYDSSGSQQGSDITSGFTEVVTGSGDYLFDYSSYPDGLYGWVVYYNGSTYLKAFEEIDPKLAENLDAKVSTRNSTTPPTAAAISTQVWSEPVPGSFTSGQAGYKLNAASSAGDPWSTSVPGSYGSGTAGNILGNRLDAAVSTRSSHSVADVWNAAMSGMTTAGSVGKRIGDNLDGAVSGVAAAVWAVLTSTLTAASSIGKRLADNVNATISSRGTSTLTSGQVENAVLDATASAHNGAGTIGEAINSSGSGAVAAFWDEPWAAHQDSGSFGELFTEIGNLSVIRVQAPVVQVGTTITLDRGADYYAVDGRALLFTDTGNSWPTLTGATITMKVQRRGGPVLPWGGTVIVGTGSNKQVRVQLTAAQTDALDVSQGLYRYRIDAALVASGHVTPLAEGHLAARDLVE